MQRASQRAAGSWATCIVSTNAKADFNDCQRRVGHEEESIDLDVRTRWRTSHNMADQYVYHKVAVLKMDKNPAYKDPGDI